MSEGLEGCTWKFDASSIDSFGDDDMSKCVSQEGARSDKLYKFDPERTMRSYSIEFTWFNYGYVILRLTTDQRLPLRTHDEIQVAVECYFCSDCRG